MRCSPRVATTLATLVVALVVPALTASTASTASTGLPRSPAAAVAEAGQSLSGRLVSPEGEPLAQVPVSAVRFDEARPGSETVAVGTSDAAGRYRIDDLPPGTYRILFAPENVVPLPSEPPRPPGVRPRYWPDVADEDDGHAVVVRPGQALDGFDAVLGDWSSLSGRIRDSTGAFGSSTSISLWRYQRVAGRFLQVRDSVGTDAAGRYLVDDLPAGTYRLHVTDPGGSTWWPAAATLEEAEDIVLGLEQGLVRDGTVLASASLAGRVTTRSGAEASFALDVERWVRGSWQPRSTGLRFTGSYLVEGLPPGRYRLGFAGESDEWWSNSPTAAGATPIELAPGERRTGLDAVLARGALIGRVLLPDGSPAAGVDVRVQRLPAPSPEATPSLVTTDAAGGYRLDLTAGRFGVVVGHPDRVGAEPTVEVTVPHEGTVRLETTVPPGGTITGRVVDGAGRPLPHVGVRVFRPDGTGGWTGPQHQLVPRTDDEGRYQLTRLAPGPVRIGVDRPGLDEPVEYWDDARVVDQAQTIAVTATSVRTGVDVVVVAEATISGRLTDTQGRPAVGVGVLATREGGFGREVGATSGASGDYTLEGLVPGRYRLRTSSGEFLPEALGEVEVPTATDTVSGPDADLARGASVAGTVRDADGAPLADAFVRLTQGGPTDPWIGNVLTTADGRYSFDRLPAGDYDVWTIADLPSGDHVDRIERIQLRDDESVALDVVADPAGTLSGTALNRGVATEVTVYGRTAQGWTQVDVVPVGLEERWASRVLPPGEYRVGVVARDRFPAFHPVASSLDDATTLVLAEGRSVPGVDLTLRGGTLRATLEAPAPLDGVELLALDAETGAVLADATAEEWDARPGGSRVDVVLGPLPSRRVRIQVSDPRGRLPVGYLGPGASLGELVARPVDAGLHLVEDGEEERLAAWLRPGNVLTGRVIPPDGVPRVDLVLALRDTATGPQQVAVDRGVGEERSFTLNGLPAADVRVVYVWNDAAGEQRAGDGGCTPDSGRAITVPHGAGGRATSTDLGERRIPGRPIPGLDGAAPPTTSGAAITGRPLVADPGPWNPCFLTLGYQWLVAGLPVPGATGRTYTPPSRFAGYPISVRVTGAYPGLAPVTVTSGQSAPLAPGPGDGVGTPVPRIANRQPPAIQGVARVGQRLVATPGRWSPARVRLRYRWFLGARAIPGATTRRLTVRRTWRGERLRVVVTATRSGFRPASARSPWTVRVR